MTLLLWYRSNGFGWFMERLYRAQVNDEGELLIPAECRKYLGLAAGQEVMLQIDDHGLRLFTQELISRTR
jgi:bifunctional DNA-binding transcriptional regulator/antitoxin component of YhaV-PrlF toxin-antitoxin module